MRADPISLGGGWQRRERTLSILVVGIFALVLLRLFTLQVLQGSKYRELSEEIVEDPHSLDPHANHERVLRACEAAIERLATEQVIGTEPA